MSKYLLRSEMAMSKVTQRQYLTSDLNPSPRSGLTFFSLMKLSSLCVVQNPFMLTIMCVCPHAGLLSICIYKIIYWSVAAAKRRSLFFFFFKLSLLSPFGPTGSEVGHTDAPSPSSCQWDRIHALGGKTLSLPDAGCPEEAGVLLGKLKVVLFQPAPPRGSNGAQQEEWGPTAVGLEGWPCQQVRCWLPFHLIYTPGCHLGQCRWFWRMYSRSLFWVERRGAYWYPSSCRGNLPNMDLFLHREWHPSLQSSKGIPVCPASCLGGMTSPLWVSRWHYVSGRILSRNHF